jgi:hypothetical protein
MNELIDLVNLLNLEPRDTELGFEFFDRAVEEAHRKGLINDDEVDAFAAYLEGFARA